MPNSPTQANYGLEWGTLDRGEGVLKKSGRAIVRSLFLYQAGVTGDAFPGGILVDPGIGESAGVLVGLAVVKALGVVDTDDDGGIAVELNLQVLHAHDGGLEFGIVNVREELVAGTELAVPFRAHEALADQALQCA